MLARKVESVGLSLRDETQRGRRLAAWKLRMPRPHHVDYVVRDRDSDVFLRQ